MGAPKTGTTTCFNVHRIGYEIEGAPKSVKSVNTRGKGKNGGFNDAFSGSLRASSLLPPDRSPRKGNKSRIPSVSNTPASRPPTSPETKKETPSRGVVGLSSRGVKGGFTDTGNRERFGKQSTNTSPHTTTQTGQTPAKFSSEKLPSPKPEANTATHRRIEYHNCCCQGWSCQQDSWAFLVRKRKSTTPGQTAERQAAGRTSNRRPPYPTCFPRNPKPSCASGSRERPCVFEFSARNHKRLGRSQGQKDDVKPAAVLSSDPPTTPASPETHNQIVPAALEDRPAPSLLENPSASAEIEGEQGFVQSTTPPEPTTTISSTRDPPPDLTPPQNPKSTLEYALDIQSTLNQISRPTYANAKSVSISVEILTSLDTAVNLLIATARHSDITAEIGKPVALIQDVHKHALQPVQTSTPPPITPTRQGATSDQLAPNALLQQRQPSEPRHTTRPNSRDKSLNITLTQKYRKTPVLTEESPQELLEIFNEAIAKTKHISLGAFDPTTLSAYDQEGLLIPAVYRPFQFRAVGRHPGSGDLFAVTRDQFQLNLLVQHSSLWLPLISENLTIPYRTDPVIFHKVPYHSVSSKKTTGDMKHFVRSNKDICTDPGRGIDRVERIESSHDTSLPVIRGRKFQSVAHFTDPVSANYCHRAARSSRHGGARRKPFVELFEDGWATPPSLPLSPLPTISASNYICL